MEDRKKIEIAKGLLMKHAGLDEPEAFRRLQKEASRLNKRLVEFADTIIATIDVLNPAP